MCCSLSVDHFENFGVFSYLLCKRSKENKFQVKEIGLLNCETVWDFKAHIKAPKRSDESICCIFHFVPSYPFFLTRCRPPPSFVIVCFVFPFNFVCFAFSAPYFITIIILFDDCSFHVSAVYYVRIAPDNFVINCWECVCVCLFVFGTWIHRVRPTLMRLTLHKSTKFLQCNSHNSRFPLLFLPVRQWMALFVYVLIFKHLWSIYSSYFSRTSLSFSFEIAYHFWVFHYFTIGRKSRIKNHYCYFFNSMGSNVYTTEWPKSYTIHNL